MRVTYRPEINGLRALAVSSVILYHSQITILGDQYFQGGFIGVDIFFVISGYLITSIILKELVTNGFFSFKFFYERRIRRIFPALLFVMLISLPVAWLYLLPISYVDFSKSILYSIGFSSNFYFWLSGQEYGADSALLKPFLHTWSLSVEEQYYILFPIVLFTTFKYFRKYIIYILILGFVTSLGLAEWSSANHPSFNFYNLPTRAWQLLAGSLLAYFEIKFGQRNNNKILSLILPSIGLFLIVHTILFFNDNTSHPSFYTLSPIIGVCLIIWFSNKGELITKILSTKLFVGIGLISYSLYLFHYPVFAFSQITEFSEGVFLNKLLLVGIIIILSIFSYYFVEQPFRNNSVNIKLVLIFVLIFIFILVIININVIQKNGYNNRLPEILQINYSHEKPWNLLKNSDGISCNLNDNCTFNTLSNKKVFIIGDSHLGVLAFDLKDRLLENNYQFIPKTFNGCIFYPGFNRIDSKTQKVSKYCNDHHFQKLKKTLSENKNSIIIFGGRFPLYFSNNIFNNQEGGVERNQYVQRYNSVSKYLNIQDSFKNEVLELAKNNKIILLYPIPEIGWDVNKKIYNQWTRSRFSRNFKINVTTSYEVYKERTKPSFELLDSIKSKNIYRVYPHSLFCGVNIKNRCITHDDKNIFYADDHHPSLKGAEMINDLIMKKIKKIKLKPIPN